MSAAVGGPIHLGWGAVAAATALILANGVLSVSLRLGLERSLGIAALRTVVQLTLLGYVLLPVFRWAHPALVLGLALLMVTLAARAAVQRTRRRYAGGRMDAFVAILLAATATTGVGVGLIIRVEPWYEPRYLLPVLGMILGNSLNGVSLGVDTCLQRFDEGRDAVEALLAAGATRAEAALPVVREAVRMAMLPMLNFMTVVGLVSIPGMMTGQLLGGTPPEQAARYQILIIFLIAAATAVGSICAILLAARAVFDDHVRLRTDRILSRGGG